MFSFTCTCTTSITRSSLTCTDVIPIQPEDAGLDRRGSLQYLEIRSASLMETGIVATKELFD